MVERRKLSDILYHSERTKLENAWSTTKAADDPKPLPAGEYRCRIINGELFNSQRGTPGYKLTFEVLDGEHAGQRAWSDVWLSDSALALAKRDLAKLGVSRLSQLEQPLPNGIIVVAKIALRRSDDGTEFNRVTGFDVVAIEPPAPDPFAPQDDKTEPDTTDADGFDWHTGVQRDGQQGVPTS